MKKLYILLILSVLAAACSKPASQNATGRSGNLKKTDAVTGRWTLVYYYSRQDDLVKTPETMNETYYFKISKYKMTRSYNDSPVKYTLDESVATLYAQYDGVLDTFTYDRRGDTLVLEGDPSRFTYKKLVLVRTP